MTNHRLKILLSTVILSATIGLGSSYSVAQSSAAEAAEIASQRTGGKVLKVKTRGSSYRVKVLMPTGQVKTITIKKNNK